MPRPARFQINEIVRRGRGPPVLIIHGGPGFDHTYLRETLGFLEPHFELLYYDQLGCGTNSSAEYDVSLEAAAAQLEAIVRELNPLSSISVLAHSWGALVLAAAYSLPDCRQLLEERISGGLLINPVPFSRLKFDESIKAFRARIPLSVQIQIIANAYFRRDGKSVMQRLWPYYMCNPKKLEMPNFNFNVSTYANVAKKLGAFDYTLAPGISKKLNVLIASHDATKPEIIMELLSASKSYEIIQDVGHFPMQEQPERWEEAIKRLLELK